MSQGVVLLLSGQQGNSERGWVLVKSQSLLWATLLAIRVFVQRSSTLGFLCASLVTLEVFQAPLPRTHTHKICYTKPESSILPSWIQPHPPPLPYRPLYTQGPHSSMAILVSCWSHALQCFTALMLLHRTINVCSLKHHFYNSCLIQDTFHLLSYKTTLSSSG